MKAGVKVGRKGPEGSDAKWRIRDERGSELEGEA